jgi:hypothetical protein
LLRAIGGLKGQDRVCALEQPVKVSRSVESGVVRSVVVVRLPSDRAAVIGRFRNTHSFCLEGKEWHASGGR